MRERNPEAVLNKGVSQKRNSEVAACGAQPHAAASKKWIEERRAASLPDGHPWKPETASMKSRPIRQELLSE